MDIQIKFYSEEILCFTLKSINRHQIKGELIIETLHDHLTHEVDGLVYQLNDDNYYFTFSINWKCDKAPIYSTFTGELKLEREISDSIIKLSWLHVNDNYNSNKCIKGNSILTTTQTPKQFSGLDFIPIK